MLFVGSVCGFDLQFVSNGVGVVSFVLYCACCLGGLVCFGGSAWYCVVVYGFTIYFLVVAVLCCVCAFVCSWISVLFGLLSVVG